MNASDFDEIPLLDDEQLDMLVESAEEGAPDLIESLLNLFIGEAGPRMDGVGEGMAQKDALQVKKSVHSLAGSSSNIGGLRLAELCRGIEGRVAEGATTDELVPLVEKVKPLTDETVEALKEVIADLREEYS